MLKMQPKPGNNRPGGHALHVAKGNEDFQRNLDLSMESAVNAIGALPDSSGQLAGPPAGRMERRLRQSGKLFSRPAHPQQGAARPARPARARTRHAPRARRTAAFRHRTRRRGNGPPRHRMVRRGAAGSPPTEAPTRCSPRAGGWRCCWPTCRANGRNSFCGPARGRRNSSTPCARPICAPARISSCPK